MLQDVAGLRESLMETRVSAAITSSRLVRLDNPITRAKLTALKRRADEVLGAHRTANRDAPGRAQAAGTPPATA